MTQIFCGILLGSTLFLIAATPLAAQDKGPPPPPNPGKVEKEDPAPVPPAAPAKYERDGGAMLVYYLIAAIAIIGIMVAICAPIRRE